MKTFRLNTLVLPLTLIAIPSVHAASIEALEQHIRVLESRLEKLAPESAAPDKNTPIDKLTRKVNILERKVEVQDEISTATIKKAPKIEASHNGFKISSPDNDFSVRLRASAQTDGRFFFNDFPHNTAGSSPVSGLADRFDLKQARVWLEGRLWKTIDYKIMPDFGNSAKVLIQDAYFDIHYLPFASLTIGKQKTPLSLERLQGDADGTFIERAYPTYLASNRDVGIMLHGEFAKSGYNTEYGGPVDFKNFISYQIGVFNGTGDNGSGDSSGFDNKEVMARLFSHPFQHSGIELLEGLGIGIAGSYEHPQERAVPNLASALGSNTIVNNNSPKFTASTDITTIATLSANGDHYRLYPQAYWYSGPFSIMTEYVWSSQQLLGQENSADAKTSVRSFSFKQDNSAWQVQAAYVLTGEDNTFQSVKPIRAFDPLKGHWGALQLAWRWSELTIDRGSFIDVGANNKFQLIDPSKSIYHAQAWAVGLNWFLNNNVRIMADYEETEFNGGAKSTDGGNRPTERVFATRFQLVF